MAEAVASAKGAAGGATGAPLRGAAPRPAMRSMRPRSSCSRSSATTPPRCGRSRLRRRSSRRRSTTGTQQGGDPRPAPGRLHRPADRAAARGGRPQHDRPALQLAAAVREHVIFHGIHSRAAFVTDSEIRALTPGPRRALIAQRDAYQERFGDWIRAGIADGSLHATSSGRRHLRDPAPVHRRGAVVRPPRPAVRRGGRQGIRRARARLAAGRARADRRGGEGAR